MNAQRRKPAVAASTGLIALLAGLLLSASALADYSREQPMTVARLNGIDIAYTQVGDAAAPPVLLVMGLTASHRLWDEDFVNGLADSGYRVVLFDNRDTGDSSRLDALGTPALWWEMLKNALGFGVSAPYTLADMAADGVAVLDALEIERAHVVGASMGGMIAQIIAADYPQRTRSLVSIMSTTGAPHLPEAEDAAADNLLGMADSEADVARRLEDMGIYPEAMSRQLLAIISAGDRSEQVMRIRVPTLVLHGEEDPLLPLPHGEHTHQLIRGSKFVSFEGMGHDMPAPVVPLLLAEMVALFEVVDEQPRLSASR